MVNVWAAVVDRSEHAGVLPIVGFLVAFAFTGITFAT